jgi:uncharacterized damage-inducible protein DinB
VPARRGAASVPVVSSYPRNPPFAADETSMLRAWIDYYRDTIRAQTAGLDADQLAARIPGHPAVMTLGGMLKHLAFVEQWWCSIALHDRPPAGIWADVDWEADADWDWSSARHDSPEELRRLFDDEVARSDVALDEALSAGGLDQAARRPRSDGEVATLRWILVHLVEEYARHAGHADLIRESVDGAVDL